MRRNIARVATLIGIFALITMFNNCSGFSGINSSPSSQASSASTSPSGPNSSNAPSGPSGYDYPSTGIQMNNMPGIWMAYPGDARPILDCQNKGTCIGLSGNVQSPALFQGFDITNSSFKFFWLDGDKSPVTWRNNIMHGITVTNPNDAYENPAFIFTQDYTGGTTPVYQHLILQNNQVYDLNNYNHDIHISPATFYDVSHSLEEDNVIHDIYDGTCIEDKDDGWYNTYRNNVCYNVDGGSGIGLYSQYSQGQIEIENNLLIGNSNGRNLIDVGSQPGYIRNIYIHNNTLVNGFIGFGNPIYNQSAGTYVIAHNLFYDDSTTAPLEFYGVNGSFDPSTIGQPSCVGTATQCPPITASQAYVSSLLTGNEALFKDNWYWSPDSTQKMMTWSWQQYGLNLSQWQNLGFDSAGGFFFTQQPSFLATGAYSSSNDYSLAPTDPNYSVYGKDSTPSANTTSYTGWALQFIGIDLTTAYPGIQYYSRLAVVGGLYPYTFKLLTAPTGMQIQPRTGEITWTPTQDNTTVNVDVQVTDSAGTTATHSFTIQVTKNNFYFIDAVNGSDSNPGTLQAPFRTLLGVQQKGLPATATLYFRGGP